MNMPCIKAAPALGLLMLLAACGGGGGGDADTGGATSSTQLRPTVFSSDGRPLNSCSFSSACSGNPYAPFTVYPDPMPPNGTTLSGLVRLQVRGIELGNVELLPATGYLPRLGVFTLSNDRTHAWLDLDTRALPNGPLAVRISAYNVAAGQPGAVEIVAMSPRTWNISNPVTAPQPFTATLAAAPANGATVSGIRRLELRGSGIANAELLPAAGYMPRLGQFNVSADRTFAWLDVDTRAFPDGMRSVRISAFNMTAGQPGASEIVAMPPRTWSFSNGASAAFTATMGEAPPQGASVGNIVSLEIRGTGLKNVELLPANSYTPIYGRFTLSADGTFGYLDLDSSLLPAGPVEVRVSAFNVAPGQAGAKEIVAMPARQWIVRR